MTRIFDTAAGSYATATLIALVSTAMVFAATSVPAVA